jgi:hypothetical protein
MHHFFGVISEQDLEAVKYAALRKHSVKKSKEPHIKAILDDAFELAMNHTGNVINNEHTNNERDAG